MALFNYNDLLNASTVSNEAYLKGESYDSLFENSFLKSADYVHVNEYDKFDIFLSHSYDDRKIIPALKRELESLGYSVYVDWIHDKLLSRQETATLLSVSLVTLWDWSRKSIIPAYRIGNKVRYKKSEILQALQQMNKF